MPIQPITSAQNQRLKDAAKLRDRRQRKQQGRIIIDGAREIERAINAGIDVVEAFICEERCQSAESRRVVALLKQSQASLYEVPPELLERVAFGERAEGVVAIATPPTVSLESMPVKAQTLVAVVDNIEKPGNLGAMIRSADGAGVSAVIATGGGTDLYNPNCIRASLGAVFTLPVVATDSTAALAWLREHGFRVFAARPDAARLYNEVDFTGRAAIVLGSEALGLAADWQALDIASIQLPMLGVADSLNVSATAAILFYEALRQRGQASRSAPPALEPPPQPSPQGGGRSNDY